MVEAAGVEPASGRIGVGLPRRTRVRKRSAKSLYMLSSVWGALAAGPQAGRRPGGQPSSSRLPPEGAQGRPAGYSASSGPATGGAGPRTSLLVKQRKQADCCQLCFSSRINEDDWFLGMQLWLQHSRRARFAPTY